jgi:hypothetical protein
LSNVKSRHVNLSVDRALDGKELELLKLILPEGYEVASYSIDKSPRYTIKKKGDNKLCAEVRFYYSNGKTMTFEVKEKTLATEEFLLALQKEHDISDSSIIAVY